jgi:hypothetical protein
VRGILQKSETGVHTHTGVLFSRQIKEAKTKRVRRSYMFFRRVVLASAAAETAFFVSTIFDCLFLRRSKFSN